MEEDADYVADELVELAEEILSQLAAVGFQHYILHAPQKELYNDFLLPLFNSSGHDYNAGPLYRWAANMVKDCPDMKASPLFRFFWEDSERGLVLSKSVHHLAELRNQVMHGFFVLPKETNVAEANKICVLMQELLETGLFQATNRFHFRENGSFTGQWNISDSESWQTLISDRPFGKLCARIVAEESEDFWAKEAAYLAGTTDDSLVLAELRDYILQNERGSFACWIHPLDDKAATTYAAIGNWLLSQPDITTIAWRPDAAGLSFTGDFLLRRLEKVLYNPGLKIGKNKNLQERVADLRKGYQGKIVVLVKDIHLALFSPQHVSHIQRFLFENKILLLATGHHYEHFKSFFNDSVTLPYLSALPNPAQQKDILHNYLRFKNVTDGGSEEGEEMQKLKDILEKVVEELHIHPDEELLARRFADSHGFEMEYVHEIFALLHPWLKSSRKSFEEDTVDELYGFPSNMTEVTPIYLALGRRDVKLEYQHKVISL